jgi:hypothetical protein
MSMFVLHILIRTCSSLLIFSHFHSLPLDNSANVCNSFYYFCFSSFPLHCLYYKVTTLYISPCLPAYCQIYCHVYGVIIDGVWIGNWIYLALTDRNYSNYSANTNLHTLQFTTARTKSSVCSVFTSGRSPTPGHTSSQADDHLTPTSYSSNCRLRTLL